ncbi:MAG: hypothetical protein ACI8S6_001742 [Myxococcota bacterium]|jgi:hypothetical protein
MRHLTLALLLSGCGFSAEIRDMVSTGKITALEEDGLVVYPGSNPPDFSGEYTFNTMEISYDSDGDAYSLSQYNQTLAAPDEDNAVAFDDEETVRAAASGTGDGCFSLFREVEVEQTGCTLLYVEILTGCLVSQGIADPQAALIISEADGTGCESAFMDEGDRRIFTEVDGMALRTELLSTLYD